MGCIHAKAREIAELSRRLSNYGVAGAYELMSDEALRVLNAEIGGN